VLSLLPLNQSDHAGLLQTVYRAVPGYWQMYGLLAAPQGQAAHDLAEVQKTPGRTILGMLRPALAAGQSPAHEMVGMLDIRLDYPGPTIASVGMVMVIEPLQRQGIARTAWSLLQPWLASTGGMKIGRVGVEQFNTPALRFFTSCGFALTGEAARTQVGEKFVRLLYMERQLLPTSP
jgi:RimJ/RimL family protein N-acetyltransferase